MSKEMQLLNSKIQFYKRLINELQMFFPIPSEYITDTNVLREFIGGSYFEER